MGESGNFSGEFFGRILFWDVLPRRCGFYAANSSPKKNIGQKERNFTFFCKM